MKKNKPYTLLNKAEPYLWILPSIILMFIFIIIPIGFVFRMAFSQVTKAGLVKGFIGLKNFEKVLSGAKFTLVLKNTIVWTLYVVILSTIPFVCFTALAGLQSIDSSYYEAAIVDGANYWQKLFNITLPLVKPSLTVATVLNIIYVFNSFPIVWTITKGDPANRTDTLVTYLYKLAFYNGKQGEAAAVSVIGFLILLVCASIYMVSTLKKGDE